jgi:amino acid transporter
MPQPKSSEPTGLSRQLGPMGMLFTGFGIIGSGWLFAALYTAQLAGPAGIISWLIGGAFIMVIALVYAELGAMLPIGGALSRIPYFAFGPFGGFMAGWLCWIAFVAVTSVEVIAVLDYASNYLPWLTISEDGNRILTSSGVGIAIALLAIFTIVNLVGVKAYARANAIMTVWKVIVPVATSIVLIAVGFRWENLNAFGGFAPNGISGIFAAVSSGGIIFAFLGFRSVVDMAGEARNPQRDVPFAIVGTISFCLILYILLQVAFIGALPASHLENGWAGITETVAGGPFAAFATLLGLHWLATILYTDAVISPAGSSLSIMASTARLNYSMARVGQAPAIFQTLNRFQVPTWSIVFNFGVGVVMVLPLPGWSELVGLITTAAVLSFAFGPISLVILRQQDPTRRRPFRIPAATLISSLAFILIGFIVYWTGWQSNWKILLIAVAGVFVLAGMRLTGRGTDEPLRLGPTAWLFPYYVGLAAISYLGNYGGGLEIIPDGVDLAILAVFSLAIFWMAVRMKLAPAETLRLMASSNDEVDSASQAA